MAKRKFPVVYLLHFDEPLGNENHAARHYIGYAEDLTARLRQHRTGGQQAARILAAAKERGITWRLARTWEGGSRELERRLKNWHKSAKLCPICRGEMPF